MGKQEELQSVLAKLRREVSDIQGSILATPDGLSLASDFPEADVPRVAAMAATALGLGKRICQGTNRGELQELVVRGDGGYLVLYAVEGKAVLAIVAVAGANLGLVNLVARQSVGELAKVLA